MDEKPEKKSLWAEMKFPPINLYNLPKQYRDISEDEVARWVEDWQGYQDLDL